MRLYHILFPPSVHVGSVFSHILTDTRLFSAFLIVAIPVGMRWSDPDSFYTALYLRSCRTAEHIEI